MDHFLNFNEVPNLLKVVQAASAFLAEKGIANSRLDAEVLVAHALNLRRLEVYFRDRVLSTDELLLVHHYLIRRSNREPLHHITRTREFFGRNFNVSPDVLIPRPETEHLVEGAVQFLQSVPIEKRIALDLGTGSGCIAISVALHAKCRVWAVDISKNALEVARSNANDSKVFSSIAWRFGFWFSALGEEDPSQFSAVMCNPPYIKDSEARSLMSEVSYYEPSRALFSGKRGLEAYQDLAPHLWKWLQPGGKAYFELHSTRANVIKAIFDIFPWKRQEIVMDLQKLPRLLILEKPITS